MLKLLQSLFGERGAVAAAWPESLIEAVIERAVDGTDPRLRAIGGYCKRLREPALATIGHVMGMVDALPEPVAVDAAAYREDNGLRAMFASLERLHDVLGKDQNIAAALRGGVAGVPLHALLVVDVSERHVLGMDLENDQVKRDVQQTVVSFDAHRLVDPHADLAECRRALKRRAFDHLLAQVLEAMSTRTAARRDLGQQRALLQRKLGVLQGAGWSFGSASADGVTDAVELERKLAAIEQELEALGPDTETLEAHLELLAAGLAEPGSRLRVEERVLMLDHRNVVREANDPAALAVPLRILHDGRGVRAALRLLAIDPALVPRVDFFAAARRYL